MNTKAPKETRVVKEKPKGAPSSGKGSSHKVNGTGIRKAGSKSKLNDAINGGKFELYI